ncbi:MAG: FAD-dependent oxidoreductase [Fuerstiella sp.]|nr:FAD-dependent oxidoreductase [Fuerstiella sp.]
MRIAVIGSGISGLVCARLLTREHQVSVFEADTRIGGHSNTVSVSMNGRTHQIDTGFIVYNNRTYPVFSGILRDLGVKTSPTSMSFSVRCDRTGLEYNGTSLNGIFAQRQNLVRPMFLRMLRDIHRFNREGPKDCQSVSSELTVGAYLNERGYSRQFAQQYLLPMGAAIWSCPCEDFAQFPVRFILEFYVHHGLLSLNNRPVWRVIQGGSQEYVRRLAAPFEHQIHINCPVLSVDRAVDHVTVCHRNGQDKFDEIVFACHSDQALGILNDADKLETELLSAFPYSTNTAVLHTDEAVLPVSKRAWASWNYHIPRQNSVRPAVTYNMNILQHIQSPHTFCVTLNEPESIDPEKILAEFCYSHPLFTTRRTSAQQRHTKVIRRRRTSFCGAYWGNGFHEDGVLSALAVSRQFGIPGWTTDDKPSPSLTQQHSPAPMDTFNDTPLGGV